MSHGTWRLREESEKVHGDTALGDELLTMRAGMVHGVWGISSPCAWRVGESLTMCMACGEWFTMRMACGKSLTMCMACGGFAWHVRSSIACGEDGHHALLVHSHPASQPCVADQHRSAAQGREDGAGVDL